MKRRPIKESLQLKRDLQFALLNFWKERRDNVAAVNMSDAEEAQILGFTKGLDYAVTDDSLPQYIEDFIAKFK